MDENPYQPPRIPEQVEPRKEKSRAAERHANRIAASFVACATITVTFLLMAIAFQQSVFFPFAIVMAWMTLMIGIAWGVHQLRTRRES